MNVLLENELNPEVVGGQEWRWCIIGNIVDTHPYGEEHEERHGTKQFSPGTKVYCAPAQWGDGWESVVVIGKPRKQRHLITIVMPLKWITNFRIQKVYNPVALSMMKSSDYRWWDDTNESYEWMSCVIKSIEDHGLTVIHNTYWPKEDDKNQV